MISSVIWKENIHLFPKKVYNYAQKCNVVSTDHMWKQNWTLLVSLFSRSLNDGVKFSSVLCRTVWTVCQKGGKKNLTNICRRLYWILAVSSNWKRKCHICDLVFQSNLMEMSAAGFLCPGHARAVGLSEEHHRISSAPQTSRLQLAGFYR